MVAGEKGPGHEVCSLVQELGYSATLINSLKYLEPELQKDPEVAVILDLDNLPLNFQFLRGLRKNYPRLHMLGVSEVTYHPGYEEIIRSHLLACLVEPLDVEELCFWLKSIGEHMSDPDVEW